MGEDIPGTYGSSQSIVYEKFELIYMRESGEQMKNSGIGGQAVIEGVMMKNKDQYAVAVRTPDGKIVVDKQEYKSISEKYRFLSLPLLRGVVAFCESMSIGMKTLTYSASFYEEEEEQTKKSETAESILSVVMVLLAAVIAVGLFIALPWFIAEKLSTVIQEEWLQALVEGGIRLVIFIAYVVAISFTKDIRRVYMYHGAEHKTINCLERGLDLTVENVKRQSKEHKRCGTSFMLYVVLISILFFMFIRVEQPVLRFALRIVLIPVVAGVSYELIRFAGRFDNIFVRIISLPGMWLQGLTTKEPDEAMIEVAIQSVEAVFDWQAFVEEVKEEKLHRPHRRKRTRMVAVEEDNASSEEMDNFDTDTEERSVTEQPVRRVAVVKKADSSVRRNAYFHAPKEETKSEETEHDEERKETPVLQERSNEPRKVAALKKAQGVRRPLVAIEEVRRDSILEDAEQDDDDDEILSALDKFFQ